MLNTLLRISFNCLEIFAGKQWFFSLTQMFLLTSLWEMLTEVYQFSTWPPSLKVLLCPDFIKNKWSICQMSTPGQLLIVAGCWDKVEEMLELRIWHCCIFLSNYYGQEVITIFFFSLFYLKNTFFYSFSLLFLNFNIYCRFCCCVLFLLLIPF